MIVAEGVPWPCAMPSPNGEVTRVVMLSTIQQQWTIATSLELPGTGIIGICNTAQGEPDSARPPAAAADALAAYLLHFLPHSLTSYPIDFATDATSPPTPISNRAVSSGNPSQALGSNLTVDAEKSLRRNKSMQSLNEESKEKETGFAKFLAARRAQTPQREVSDETKAGVGEGIEVVRDGYGEWKSVKMSASGEGIGIGAEAIDLFRCDGKSLEVKGSVSGEGAVGDALFSAARGILAITVGVSRLYSFGLATYRSKRSRCSKGSPPRVMVALRRSLEFAFTRLTERFELLSSTKEVIACGMSDTGELIIVSQTGVSSIGGGTESDSAEPFIKLCDPMTSNRYTALLPYNGDHVFNSDSESAVFSRPTR